MHTTYLDVSQFTDAVIEEAHKRGYPRDVYGDLFFYGNTCPLNLTHNDIEVVSDCDSIKVIATKDIPANVIITHFPVHAMVRKGELIVFEGEKKDETFVRRIESEYLRTHSHYMPVYNKINTPGSVRGVQLVGNPRNMRNPLLLGHVIGEAYPEGNVFSHMKLEQVQDWTTFKNCAAKYYMGARKARNCHYVVNRALSILSVESTCEIKAGEELRIVRGPEYWYHRRFYREDTEYKGDDLFEALSRDEVFQGWAKKLFQ